MGEPQVYGKYQLLSRIASGGMAEVWLARSSSIGGFEKILAIKRMHPRLSANRDFVSLFIEEAKLTVSLNHPNIVQIFDFGRVDDDYYIAMEYVEGVDFAAVAARARKLGTPLPVDVVFFAMSEVFEGLAYAHGRRNAKNESTAVIHRDISPHNILLSLEGQVKISDFGIAKAAEEISATGQIVGKVAYIAPEQARGDQIGPAADLWSAGVILHEALSNERLFARDNEPDTLEAVLEHEVTAPSSHNTDVPEEIDALVLSLLERDEKKRPTDARHVAEVLQDNLRRLYPKTKHQRLAEVIRDLWGDEMVPLLAGESLRPRGSVSLDATVPSQTASSFAHDEPSDTDVRGRAPLARSGSTEHTRNDDIDSTQVGEIDVQREVERLQALFHTNPSLWTLVDIGEVYQRARREDRALAMFRLAAAMFAQGGFLAQAVAIYHRLVDQADDPASLDREIGDLGELQGVSNAELFSRLFDGREPDSHLDEYRDLLDLSAGDAGPPITARAPILGALDREQLVKLFHSMRLYRVSSGEVVLREGEASDSFFWIGRGRVVVSTTNFENRKAYLTSLAEGDCFGEQAFFTQKARTASVETAEECLLLEVDRRALDNLVRAFPAVEDTLRQFYKDRIAESLIARSPLFGRLGARDRRAMSERFRFEKFPAAEVLMAEGETSDAFYAIRSGRVHVFTEGDGEKKLIAELGPGDVFGEMAAVKGTPRTASVATVEECELLVLEAEDLKSFLAQNKEVAARVEETMQQRERERSELTKN